MEKTDNKFLTKITGIFQYFAGALMVPIIILVVCGILMGFASPFVNYIFTKGTLAYSIAYFFMSIAQMIMSNLPLWFLVGISVGIAKKNKGYAALAGVFMFMAFNLVISKNAELAGFTAQTVNVEHLVNDLGYLEDEAIIFTKLFKNVLGVYTYDMSIFSSIICGLTAGLAMNKWGDIKLPNLLEFFQGPKFVMLLIPLFAVVFGTMSYYIWPVFDSGLNTLSVFISNSGLIGTFIYGVLNKALLPFGIHHLIANPLLYTDLGGTMIVDGIEYAGIRNIENALIGSPTATSCLVRNLTNGRLPQNFGAFPGAALAMYQAAKPENRKKVAAILVPAVFTAAFVGITEPIEFTVLLASPALYYLVHVPLSGLGMVLAEAFGVALQGFALVFMIPNILQPQKMHAIHLIWMIPLFFALYYFIFRWAIVKFDLKTPGRETNKEIRLKSKKEYQESIGLKKADDKSKDDNALAQAIIEAFGGASNILTLENCFSRLRVSVSDPALVKEPEYWVSDLEAIGTMQNGNAYQIIYGPKVLNISVAVKEKLNMNN